MAKIKILGILALAALFCDVNSYKTIYRKYERKHPNKNYVEVYEIFGTQFAPPPHSKNDKDLNDFLARDAYKVDMNCSKVTEGVDVEIITQAATTTPFPTKPTTAYRRRVTPPTSSTRSPNLNNLFTVRPTRPTIRPNPRNNSNPDYENLNPWLKPLPKPNVQVTKHPQSTTPPTMVIQETDDHPTTNRTSLIEIDEDLTARRWPTTTQIATTTKTSVSEFEDDDDDPIYPDSGEQFEDDQYDENRYQDVIPDDQVGNNDDPQYESENEDNSIGDGEDDYDEEHRRKRRKSKRLASLKRKYTEKSNQLSSIKTATTNTFQRKPNI